MCFWDVPNLVRKGVRPSQSGAGPLFEKQGTCHQLMFPRRPGRHMIQRSREGLAWRVGGTPNFFEEPLCAGPESFSLGSPPPPGAGGNRVDGSLETPPSGRILLPPSLKRNLRRTQVGSVVDDPASETAPPLWARRCCCPPRRPFSPPCWPSGRSGAASSSSTVKTTRALGRLRMEQRK